MQCHGAAAKLQHPRGFQANNPPETPPILEVSFFVPVKLLLQQSANEERAENSKGKSQIGFD